MNAQEGIDHHHRRIQPVTAPARDIAETVETYGAGSVSDLHTGADPALIAQAHDTWQALISFVCKQLLADTKRGSIAVAGETFSLELT